MKGFLRKGGIVSLGGNLLGLNLRKSFFVSNLSHHVAVSSPLKAAFMMPFGNGGIGAGRASSFSFIRNASFTKTTAKISPSFSTSRSMATHRDLGYGRGGSGGNFNWGRFSRYRNIFLNHKTPLLFTVGVLSVTTFIFPLIFQIPGFGVIKKRPELVVYTLIGLNLAGFLAWKTKKGSRFMYRYGLLHKDSQFNKWSMIGSAFSHQEFWHIGINMYVLYNFGTAVATWLGSEQFLAAYIDGAVISSLASLMLPVLIRRFQNIPSLGASGAVFTTFGLFSYLAPHAKLGLLFIPLPFGAWTVFLGTVAYNAAGMFMRFGLSDYAGHLGGSIVGIAWGYYLTQRARRAAQRRRVATTRF